jgi:DNA-binding LacI/PurR family transcriptional regulator
MTVSLALRNHPSLPAATRLRLRSLAAARGYRPDPDIARLMHHLRTRRVHRRQATLCGLCLQSPPGGGLVYGAAVLAGARARAEALGFGLDVMAIDEPGLTPSRIERILLSRGIAGLLLLPMREPVQLARLLDWSKFSAVSATPSVLSPRLNETMPDLFGNTLLLCRELTRRGCRRIGLVSVVEHDVRVHHRVLAPFLWHSRFEGGGLPPLVSLQYEPEPRTFRTWTQRHRPDAIVTNSESTLEQIHEFLSPAERRRIILAATGLLAAATARFAGIVDNAPEVGSAATEMLAAMVQRGECGLPATPRIISIAGQFHLPRSRPRRSIPAP